ncbi:hypothetical protein IE53DRAFT_320944 [Violaceomyces palustris]|uniref:Uncharacterized protein n=1 Tax=Violaceomyces palustris TaxID=1673888 RepID=A0ACD0NP83_9BASI|nr:hypothetical protein IE53DRAFT_320944 [Violaceomyces palustris]
MFRLTLFCPPKDVKDIGYGESWSRSVPSRNPSQSVVISKLTSLPHSRCIISLVINYDFPTNTEDYVHQIGRTGRAGRKGTAYTFFTTENAKQARELVGILKEAKQEIPREIEEMCMYRGGGGGGRGGGRGYRGRGGGGGRGGFGGARSSGANSYGMGGSRW